jgi:hypothetical protein
MTYKFEGMSIFDKSPSFSFTHPQLSQLIDQPILERVICLVVAFFFTNLALQVSNISLEFSFFMYSSLYASWVKRSMYIIAPKAIILGIGCVIAQFVVRIIDG